MAIVIGALLGVCLAGFTLLIIAMCITQRSNLLGWLCASIVIPPILIFWILLLKALLH